jgi:hypothetical protein
MYVGSNGAGHIHIQKLLIFKNSNSTVLWKKMQVRGPKAMYACVEKFRVIIDAP